MSHLPYSQRGDASTDSFYITWPLAKLVVETELIILSIAGRKYEFERSSIQDFGVNSILFRQVLRIHHTKSEYPAYLIFWPFHPWAFKSLRAVLEEQGYPVKEVQSV